MFDISLWLIIGGVCAIFYIFYLQVTKNETFFADRGVRYIKPRFLFGSSMEFFFKKIELIDFIKNLYNAMPNERCEIYKLSSSSGENLKKKHFLQNIGIFPFDESSVFHT